MDSQLFFSRILSHFSACCLAVFDLLEDEEGLEPDNQSYSLYNPLLPILFMTDCQPRVLLARVQKILKGADGCCTLNSCEEI
eukprot:751088-Hanusia_phi.AAC.1